jgi:hypothetical protein
MTDEQFKFFFLGYLFAWGIRGAFACLRAAREMRGSSPRSKPSRERAQELAGDDD